MRNSPTNLKQGQVFGNWRVDKEISQQGGQAVVWRARSTISKHSPPVALKILRHDDGQSRSRFAQEAELLRSVTHPHVVGVRDIGKSEGYEFIALDLASFSLDVLLQEAPRAGTKILGQSPTVVLDFFRQACQGVAYLHAQGILHRDMKPANILVVDEAGEVLRAVVADLGIASLESLQGNITKVTEVVGSPGYRAPEVAMGYPATAKSDVYSLGRTLEAAFCGKHPQTLEPLPCPRGRLLDASSCEALDAIISKACAQRPDDRFESVEQFLEALPSFTISLAGGAATSGSSSVLLEFDERVGRVLAELIGQQTDQEPTPVYSLASQLDRSMTSYNLAVAIDRLRAANLVEIRDVEDRDGEHKAYWVTVAGFRQASEWDEHLSELASSGYKRRGAGGGYGGRYASGAGYGDGSGYGGGAIGDTDDDLPF